MPFLFLSPSTQDFNPYVTTGNEQYWMNRIADEMEPYLRASGVNFTRNNPAGNAAQSIRDSNAGQYDFHLALHSNAMPEASAGTARGVDIYYSPMSEAGLRMANIIVDNLRPIYPLPEKVRALSTVAIGEVRRTRAPAVLAELGYHDNLEDEAWITGNIEPIAAALVESVCEYFGLPFLQPMERQEGTVVLTSGALNLRAAPSYDAPVYLQIPNGETVTVWGEYDNWYVVEYDGTFGYVRGEYLRLSGESVIQPR